MTWNLFKWQLAHCRLYYVRLHKWKFFGWRNSSQKKSFTLEKLRGVWKIKLLCIKVTTSTIQPERKGNEIIFVSSLKSVAGGTWFRVSNYLWQDTIIEFCHILETGWGWFYGQCFSIGPNIVICLISCRDVDLMTTWNTISAASSWSC